MLEKQRGRSGLGAAPLLSNISSLPPAQFLILQAAFVTRKERGLWPGFVNYVEGRFGSPAETTEPGRGGDLPNARFAGLRA
jgi:hypothetical protein